MEESKDCRSISLSLFLVRLFAIALAALDIAIWPISGALRQVLPFFGQADAVLLTVCLYLCNVPGFWLLRCMGVLLRNLRKGEVFVEGNVQLLRQISGAGQVQVLLSYRCSAERELATDDSGQPAIISAGGGAQAAVELRTVSPQYLGAVVVCDGADAPQVQLAVTQAVAQFTGLSTDRISVLKMQPDA